MEVFLARIRNSFPSGLRHPRADRSTRRDSSARRSALLPRQGSRGARPAHCERLRRVSWFQRRLGAAPVCRELSLLGSPAQTAHCRWHARRERRVLGLHQGRRVFQPVCGCGRCTRRERKWTYRVENQGRRIPETTRRTGLTAFKQLDGGAGHRFLWPANADDKKTIVCATT